MYIGTFLKIYLLIILCGEADFEVTMKNKHTKSEEALQMGDDDGPLKENTNIIDDNNLHSPPTKRQARNSVDASSSSTIPPCDADSSSTVTTYSMDCKQRSSHVDNNDIDKTSSSCMAVVLYQPELNNPLKLFQIPTRTFEFAGRQLTIKQKWDDHGVAAVVWDAAVVLCEFLEREKHLVKNKNIIELGSGTGLVGLVAAYLGGNVTVTERESVLDNLHSIVKGNVQDDDDETQIRVLELDWKDDLTDSFSPEYDLILGADIIYIEETFPDLQRTLLYLSNRPNSMILLSCKIRYEKDSNFLEKMKNDFTVKRLVYDAGRDISIYKIKRKPIDQ